MKFAIKTLKPRNPLVAASRMRRAGVHRGGSTRQQAGRALRLELERLRPSP